MWVGEWVGGRVGIVMAPPQAQALSVLLSASSVSPERLDFACEKVRGGFRQSSKGFVDKGAS